MKHRSSRTILTIAAVLALSIALAGASIAAQPQNPGSQGHAKSGLKTGVNKVKGGTTTLTADPLYATAIANAGITIAAVAPATAPVAGTYVLPITGGKLVYHKTKKAGSKSKSKKQLSGFVTHAGGISLTKAATTATLSSLRINLSANRTGRIDAQAAGAPLKLAKLSNVTINATNKQISARATLTPEAIQAINSLYGTTFTGTVVLGTLVIAPTF